MRTGAPSASGPTLRPAGPARWPGVSFFICQVHPGQCVVDGGQGTVQAHSVTQIRQGQVRLFAQQLLQAMPMFVEDDRFATGELVPRLKIPGSFTLLEQLLDHAQRHAIAVGHGLARSLVRIVG